MKNNKKGFTLVELIVVMALMSVIMMAIMYIMGPARKYYARTENNKNEETVCIAVSNAISDELKYATDVKVVVWSVGDAVPTVPSSNYKNLIIINNSDDRPGSKKKAKGFAYKTVATDVAGTHGSLIMEEPFYGEDEYNISISSSTYGDTTSYMMLEFTSYPLSYNGTSYVKADTAVDYNLKKSIEFVNINKKADVKVAVGGFSAINPTELTKDQDKIYIFYTKPEDV